MYPKRENLKLKILSDLLLLLLLFSFFSILVHMIQYG